MRDFNHRPEGKGRKGRVFKKLRFLSYLVAAVNRKFSLIWKMVDNADGFAEFTLAGIVGGEVADELDAVVCGGDTGAAGFGVGEDAVAESEPPGSPPGVTPDDRRGKPLAISLDLMSVTLWSPVEVQNSGTVRLISVEIID
nr:hypothetical protein Iba_chr13dCG8040 [Ipomoea batatas]